MKLNQLSVFLENKPGRLSEPCKILAEAGINILTLSLADTQQFGILRLIVRDWKTAKEELEKAGCVVKVTEVVAIDIEDRPGGLQQILRAIDKCNINVEYMYAFTFRKDNKAIIVFCFDQPDDALAKLEKENINAVGSVELFERVEE